MQHPLSIPVWMASELIYSVICTIKEKNLVGLFLVAGFTVLIAKDHIPANIVKPTTMKKVGKGLLGVGVITLTPDFILRTFFNNIIIAAPQIIEFLFRSGGLFIK